VSSVTLVDYGVGNLASLDNMLDFLGAEVVRASTVKEIQAAEKLILPGVGAFDRAMSGLAASGLLKALDEAVLDRKLPILGVCLGMQLLGLSSEEGQMPGLGWLQAKSKRLAPKPESGLKVPNNGWQTVYATKPTALISSDAGAERFYFNHSFHMVCDEQSDVAATIEFDGAKVCSVARDNIYGVQFHPEKSHRYGMRLLSAFAALPD
jgi:glutamine amidotransferase